MNTSDERVNVEKEPENQRKDWYKIPEHLTMYGLGNWQSRGIVKVHVKIINNA